MELRPKKRGGKKLWRITNSGKSKMAAERPELFGGPFWDLEGMDGGKNGGWEGEKC